MERILKEAKNTIQINMFSLDKKSIVDILIDEAKKGVKVQVIMDPPNDSFEEAKKASIEKLRKNGVDVQIYPVKEAGSAEARYGQLDHVKMVVVDGERAIIGGMNWGEHSPANRDVDVLVEGPAVEKMEWMFRDDWTKSGGDTKQLPYIRKKAPQPQGDTMVNFITSGIERKEQTIGFSVNRAIQNARKSVHAQLFVLTDKETISNLIAAKERGVDVKVILNPLKIKDSAVNERAAQTLKDAGVPVRWFKCNPDTQQKMHAKMGIFDDDQVILGSANWTSSGFKVNREANVEILSREVNKDLQAVFTNDWEKNTTESPIYLTNPDNNAGG